ncbi:hypothetical protein BC829DRAFT_418558 [Chytridium lagenaria]|nr:hypothetical protein BC829DRAFT_418558 [Chytridium lagenaria]
MTVAQRLASIISHFKLDILYLRYNTHENNAQSYPSGRVFGVDFDGHPIPYYNIRSVRFKHRHVDYLVAVYARSGLINSFDPTSPFTFDRPTGILSYQDSILISPSLLDSVEHLTPLWPNSASSPHIFPITASPSSNPTYRDQASIFLTLDENLEVFLDRALNDHRLAAKDYASRLPARLALAKGVLAKYHRENALSKANQAVEPFKFSIGDQVWLSVPHPTEVSAKFAFRWAGPMRIISVSSDRNHFNLVEYLPNGCIMPRWANAARLRPFRNLPPSDLASDAASQAKDDDFAAEVKAWRELEVLQRKPAHIEVHPGVNRELFRRFDPTVADAHPDDPEFYIERLADHDFDEDDRVYRYSVKYLGQGSHQNRWYLESDLPKLLVEDYWNDVLVRSPFMHMQRMAFLKAKASRPPKVRGRPRKIVDPPPIHHHLLYRNPP